MVHPNRFAHHAQRLTSLAAETHPDLSVSLDRKAIKSGHEDSDVIKTIGFECSLTPFFANETIPFTIRLGEEFAVLRRGFVTIG